VLTSLKNPWVKVLRKLHQTKYRRSHQQFLVEGTHLVQEAIAVQYPLQAVCATPRWQAAQPQLWHTLCATTERQELVSEEVLAAIATTKTPDGVVAIAQPTLLSPPAAPPRLGLAIESLQDPGNVGTLMRTAVAVDCDGLWLSDDSVDVTHPKVLRASAGQWFRLPSQVVSDFPAQLSKWQSLGCQVLATASTGAIPYWEIDFAQPTVLVLGNEGAGLSAAAIAHATEVITIPMANAVESLNVGVAAAIILFEARRQHLQRPLQ
jgi:TrmH family RNA methyltransferase